MLFAYARHDDSRRWRILFSAVSVGVVLAAAHVLAVNRPAADDLNAGATEPADRPSVGSDDKGADSGEAIAGEPGSFLRRDLPQSRLRLGGDDGSAHLGREVEGCPPGASGRGAAGVASVLPALDSEMWREAPDLEFVTVDGSTVRLSDLRGKVVLVDFWASWCPPCVDELPHLEALDRQFGGADFQIVGVSVSRGEDAFEKFVSDHEIQWPQRHEAEGLDSATARAFGLRALPSHYLVDRKGRFVPLPRCDPDVLARTVARLIDES